jgi:hypothetical protein
MAGAASAQEACTEQAPEPCGSCFERGAGFTGGICAKAGAQANARIEIEASD